MTLFNLPAQLQPALLAVLLMTTSPALAGQGLTVVTPEPTAFVPAFRPAAPVPAVIPIRNPVFNTPAVPYVYNNPPSINGPLRSIRGGGNLQSPMNGFAPVPVYETYLTRPAAPAKISNLYVPQAHRYSSRNRPLDW